MSLIMSTGGNNYWGCCAPNISENGKKKKKSQETWPLYILLCQARTEAQVTNELKTVALGAVKPKQSRSQWTGVNIFLVWKSGETPADTTTQMLINVQYTDPTVCTLTIQKLRLLASDALVSDDSVDILFSVKNTW